MASHPDDQPTIFKERRVLQALCLGDSKTFNVAQRLLSGHRWREPIHQIVFSCLTSFPAGGTLALRERLTECATRKGFPDIEWDDFFPPHPISTQEAEQLMRQLRDSDPEEPELHGGPPGVT
jgi:hypothetical protein